MVLYIKRPRLNEERIVRGIQSAINTSHLEVLFFVSSENVNMLHAVNFYERGYEMSETAT